MSKHRIKSSSASRTRNRGVACLGAIGTVTAFALIPASAQAVPPAGCAQASDSAPVICTYAAGADTAFAVPYGVTSVHVVLVGGKGGSSKPVGLVPAVGGGAGGRLEGDLVTVPQETLSIRVAGNAAGATGGHNGGGTP